MTISDVGLNLIKRFEGLRLTAYDDGVGVWTVGFGHTKGVQPGDKITEEQATDFLRIDVAEASDAVARLVTVALSQNQRDALISLVYNIGSGAFEGSTLLRKLNAGDHAGAADEFTRWNKGGGRVLAGLVKRRAAERELFMSTMSTKPQGEAMPLAPFIAAALPAIIEAAPKLGALFGSGSEVAERNVKAAEIVVGIAKDALGAKNEQEAVDAIKADPQAAQAVRQAVESQWLTIVEAGGNGIAGARQADATFAASGRKPWESPAFWISIALIVMPYLLLVDVFYVHPEQYDMPLRTQIVTGVLGVIALVGAFWLGSSFGSQKKDERK
jgi:GH24 family phage-related lysozyme (muramidase)